MLLPLERNFVPVWQHAMPREVDIHWPRPATTLRRQQRRDKFPLRIRQIPATHDCSSKNSLESEVGVIGNLLCQHGLRCFTSVNCEMISRHGLHRSFHQPSWALDRKKHPATFILNSLFENERLSVAVSATELPAVLIHTAALLWVARQRLAGQDQSSVVMAAVRRSWQKPNHALR